ncbi:MAG: LPS translocon maturation chaperone LptM [Alphaproteobacteria bacterium]
MMRFSLIAMLVVAVTVSACGRKGPLEPPPPPPSPAAPVK